jgi:hypothetical protein
MNVHKTSAILLLFSTKLPEFWPRVEQLFIRWMSRIFLRPDSKLEDFPKFSQFSDRPWIFFMDFFRYPGSLRSRPRCLRIARNISKLAGEPWLQRRRLNDWTNLKEFRSQIKRYKKPGWWFGNVWNIWIIFHFIYGMSSFPLTNSYFSEG